MERVNESHRWIHVHVFEEPYTLGGTLSAHGYFPHPVVSVGAQVSCISRISEHEQTLFVHTFLDVPSVQSTPTGDSGSTIGYHVLEYFPAPPQIFSTPKSGEPRICFHCNVRAWPLSTLTLPYMYYLTVRHSCTRYRRVGLTNNLKSSQEADDHGYRD